MFLLVYFIFVEFGILTIIGMEVSCAPGKDGRKKRTQKHVIRQKMTADF